MSVTLKGGNSDERGQKKHSGLDKITKFNCLRHNRIFLTF
jgi:hypothetical protein